MAGNNYSPTTRFQNGVTNAAPWQTMGNAGTPDPTWAYQYWDDFNFKDADKWSLTGVGTPTWSVGSNANGVAAVTCTSGATDTCGLYQSGSYIPLANKPVFFKAQLTLSNNSYGAGEFGLSTTPTATGGDGMYFQYTGGADLVFRVKNGASDVTVTLTGLRMSANLNALTELGFYYDGRGWVYIFVNPTTGDNTPINAGAGQPRGYVACLPAVFTSTNAAIKAHYLAAGNTAGNVMYIDYLLASAER